MSLRYLFLTNAGRLNRKAYWIGILVLVATYGILLIVVLGVFDLNRPSGKNFDFASSVTKLAFLYPAINLGIKRYHDRGKSGWWVLIGFVPIIGQIWYLFEAGFLPGTVGSNQYGPDPIG